MKRRVGGTTLIVRLSGRDSTNGRSSTNWDPSTTVTISSTPASSRSFPVSDKIPSADVVRVERDRHDCNHHRHGAASKRVRV